MGKPFGVSEIRIMQKRYLFAFASIFLCAALAQVFVQLYIHEQEKDAKVINLAGRQRMLSQRIARFSNSLAAKNASSFARKELSKALETFVKTHEALRDGSEKLNIAPPFNRKIKDMYENLDSLVFDLESAAKCAVNDNCEGRRLALERVNLLSERFLEKMNNLVFLSAAVSRQRVRFLSSAELTVWGVIAALMGIELFCILLPFNKRLLAGMRRSMIEKEKQEREIQKQSKLASLGELTAGIVHELANPAGVISGHLEFIKMQGADCEKLPVYLERMETASKRIVSFVSRLKKFSRQSHELSLEEKRLSEIVSESAELLSLKAKWTGVAVEVDIREDVSVVCDELQISQILVNLIANAIDANEREENSWVRVSVSREGGKAIVRVLDSGNGIGDEMVDKVFEPFYTTKGNERGTGLGLSISASIAAKHGGFLRYSLEEGHTAFTLVLPLEGPSIEENKGNDQLKV